LGTIYAKKSFWKSDWFLVVDFLYLIPPIDNLDSHLCILEYLNSRKTSALALNSEYGKMRNDMMLKPLYQLHGLIIGIFITYSIIRGSEAANIEPNTASTESQALVVQRKDLDKHHSQHNYTPFCLYLVAGVRLKRGCENPLAEC
jgi:hypothetical protein